MAPPPNSSHPLHVLPLQSLAHDSDNGGGGGGFGGSVVRAGSVPVPRGQSASAYGTWQTASAGFG